MLDTVALKIADGSLRPLIKTTTQGNRRVVLSTEVDHQEGVVIELYHGIGQGVFDHQLLDTISIDSIPQRIRQDLDIVLNLSVNDTGELSVRVSVDGTDISYGRTYSINEPVVSVDLEPYLISDRNVDLPSVSPEKIEATSPIDEEFVLGIDPYISYQKEDIRREDWSRKKKSINKGVRVSAFCVYLLITLGGLLLLAFFVYLGIALPPLPPLEV